MMASFDLHSLGAYKYERLDPNRHEIRLITFSYLDKSGPPAVPLLEWKITHVSRDDEPKYLALSYAWGKPQKESHILLNGRVHRVTESLKTFFDQFRHPNESLPFWIQKIQRDQGQEGLSFWIDAICINQEDELEKAEQVQQMRSIYSQASQVIAWLGPAADNSGLAIRKLTVLARDYYSRGFCIPLAEEFWGPEKRDKIEERSKFLSDLTIHDRGNAYLPLTPILKFFKRNYWLRLWVIQELAVCKQVSFVCGNDLIEWDYFATAMIPLGYLHTITRTYIDKFDERREFFEAFPPGPMKIMHFRYGSELDRYDPRSFGLLSALEQASASGFTASDPRDVVFALLGIANDREELNIKVDYLKSCPLIYTETARAFLRQNDLQFLAAVEHPKKQTALPSWVPDWSVRTKFRYFRHGRKLDPPFLASGTSAPSIHLQTGAQMKHLLLLSGIKVDEVRISLPTGLDMELGSDLMPDIRSHIKWLDELESLLSSFSNDSRYGTSAEDAEALWRTPILDHESIGNKPTDTKAGLASQYAYRVLRGLVAAPPGENEYSWRRRESSSYWQKMEKSICGKSAFVSGTGYLGLGPEDLRFGDLICIFLGAATPFILRPSHMGRYTLIGEAYVHGIMYGEIMGEGRNVETFILE